MSQTSSIIDFCDSNIKKEAMSLQSHTKQNDINLLFFNSSGASVKTNDQPNLFNFMSSDNANNKINKISLSAPVCTSG